MNETERKEYQNYLVNVILNKVKSWNFDYNYKKYAGQYKGYRYSVSWLLPSKYPIFISVESFVTGSTLSFTSDNAIVIETVEKKWTEQQRKKADAKAAKEDLMLKELVNSLKKQEEGIDTTQGLPLPY